ncbi:MAG: M17 family peptidase N-terminal domain-containing protein, partial [Bauldia sp.]
MIVAASPPVAGRADYEAIGPPRNSPPIAVEALAGGARSVIVGRPDAFPPTPAEIPMTDFARIVFAKKGEKPAGALVLLAGPDAVLGPQARALGLDDLVRRAAELREFTGKARSTLELITSAGAGVTRVILVGTGDPAAIGDNDWTTFGGAAMGAIGNASSATVFFERPDGRRAPRHAAADFALGMKLRAYEFDQYKPSKDDNGNRRKKPADIAIVVSDVAGARSAWVSRAALAEGVLLARDLVNEPPNMLGPVEFADR